MDKTFYITTPIYYPNDKLHIGHAYSTVATDTMARYKRLRGYDVKFLTGTDEHGQKIEQTANSYGVSPKEHVDKVDVWIKELWKSLDVSYDSFIRTTDEKHVKAVQRIFKKLYDQGDIYKGEYEGWYCTPCETFFTEHQLVDNKCPDCSRDVEKVKEESYFFRLSKYQDRLIKYIEDNPEFIEPQSRRNEMLNNFLKPGLEDLSVSRTSFKWGIPVEFDPDHVIYVWIDALTNYITALGYMSDDDSEFKKYWPADVHIIGKEIVRFHTIIWPAILMALGVELPKKVFGHGWLLIGGGKMSKSKGNVIDPKILVERYGVDAVRYFLMREVSFGQDGNFNNEALIIRINSDLANDLGNLVSRTVAMIEKYFNSKLQLEKKENKIDSEIISLSKNTVKNVEKYMDSLQFSDALIEIWKLIKRTNKYIDETSPWILAKDDSQKAELSNILYMLSESIRIISILIKPFMPNTFTSITSQFKIASDISSWDSTKQWGLLPQELEVCKDAIIFPRIDINKELEELEKALTVSNATNEAVSKDDNILVEEISINDFAKIELKVGVVVECEKVAGSDKLLKSQVRIGKETRQIISGIAKFYSPEEMLQRKVIVVTNLKPIKLRGQMSYGMILCGEDENNNLSLVTVDKSLIDGSIVR